MDVATPTFWPKTEAARDFLADRDKKLLIDGRWTEAKGGTIASIDPATGQVLGMIGRASTDDVDLAVAAARRAFEGGPWPAMTPLDRAKLLWRIADLIEAHIDALAEL
jgi:phenylacetaldehyde dehydrogenase